MEVDSLDGWSMQRARWGGLASVAAVVVLVAVAGCSDTGVVGRRVDNFTAYYNTFHNANEAFEEGVEQIEDRNRPIDPSVYLPVFLEPPEGGGGDPFDQAIQKSADVLREHPTSKWVDDALLLIGKSYYYQGNDVGAQQKFREVVDLETEKEGEARFWLARTLVASRQFEAAAQVLNASLADEQEDFGTWTARMQLARGQLYVRQSRWEEAEEALVQGLNGDLPDDVEARGAFLLGQVRETLEDYGGAARAYDLAAKANPRYELSYAAQYAVVRTASLHGDTETAFERLRGMERDDKNYEKRFELRLLRARLLRAQGRPKAARQTLREMMYEEDERPPGDVTARAHYALGVLYRDAFGDFSTAAAHFDSASTSLQSPQRSSDEQRQVTPRAITDSEEQAEQFGDLAEKAATVSRLDSLLRLGRLPETEFRAFVADLREQRRERQEEVAEARRERASASRFQSRGATFDDASRAGRGQQSLAASQSSDAGFLFYEDPARVQEGKRSFERTWGDRPRADNWRRIEAVGSGRRPVAAQQAASSGPEEAAETGPRIDVSAVPRDAASQQAMEEERALARYELANALFLSANRPDSAATWYQTILDETPDHPVARRALYALAEVRYAQGQTDRAQALYRRVLEQYPDSPFAARARQRLNLEGAPATTDSSAVLEARYQQAYERWQDGKLEAALASMSELARTHPTSDVAPRAMLASSMIYLQQVRADTTAASRDPLARLLASTAPMAAGASSGPDTTAAPDPAPGPAPDSGAAPAADLRPDSTRAPVRPDTSRVRRVPDADSLDAAGQPDPSPRGDTTGLRGRSAASDAVADSVGTRVGDEPARRDTSAGSDPMAPVIAVLTRLSSAYADTPQARRAQSMLAALRAPADSARADTLRTDSLRTDSLRADGPAADSLQRAPRRDARPAADRRRDPPRPAMQQGAVWTIVVGPYDNVDEASRQVDSLRAVTDQQVPVQVETTGGRPTKFQITLGRFDTQREAAAFRARLRDALPEGAALETREGG